MIDLDDGSSVFEELAPWLRKSSLILTEGAEAIPDLLQQVLY